MTFIVSLGNSKNFIQLSDRRLSFDGKIKDDEANKTAVFVCKNARLAVGFTGLAKCGGFDTQSWMTKLLCDCGPPDFDAKLILERFSERATIEFLNNPYLKNVSRYEKRLSIMFTGYLYHHDPPLGALGLISNFENLDSNTINMYASENFSVNFHTEPRPNPPRIKLFKTIGFSPNNLYANDFNKAIDMMVDELPLKNIEWKIVEYIRSLSMHSSSRNTIGEQISSVIIPSDRSKEFVCSYYPTKAKIETYFPNFICAIDRDNLFATKNVRLSSVSDNNTPFVVGPKLKGNQKCWCESGKKYKYCHDSKRNINPLPSIDFRNLIPEFKNKKKG